MNSMKRLEVEGRAAHWHVEVCVAKLTLVMSTHHQGRDAVRSSSRQHQPSEWKPFEDSFRFRRGRRGERGGGQVEGTGGLNFISPAWHFSNTIFPFDKTASISETSILNSSHVPSQRVHTVEQQAKPGTPSKVRKHPTSRMLASNCLSIALIYYDCATNCWTLSSTRRICSKTPTSGPDQEEN